MSKVLIIGAGGVGRVTTHKCAQVPEVFSEITLASRMKPKCDQIASEIERDIKTAQVDADNVKELVALIDKEQPEAVIHVALPYQDLSIIDACLETGVHYIDTASYEPREKACFEYSYQWKYHEAYEKKGITALLGIGFDPGCVNVYCAHALKHHFDEMYYINIRDCNAGDHGQPFATNFNPEINIREITAQGRYYEDGEWKITDPLSISEDFDFPEGIGTRKAFLMFHEELESIVKWIPSIKRLRFWMTFTEQYLTHPRVLENVGMTSIEPIHYEGKDIVPLQFLKAVLPDPSSLGPLTKGKTCIGCWINGIKDGKE